MAEEQDSERELPASQKRLDDARARGQTPRSRELTTAALLLGGAAGIVAFGPRLVGEAREFLRGGLTLTRAAAFDPAVALESAAHVVAGGIVLALPVLAILFLAALCAPLAIGGWVFSTHPLMPDFARLSPLRGLGNLFSLNGIAELAKAIAKVALVGGILGWLIWHDQAAFVAPLAQSGDAALASAGTLITRDFLWMAAVLVALAAADVPLQLWQHARGLRMTRDEVRREGKEAEGDPHVKGRIRQRQREAARRRMMAAVPTADVVVTNPTHYAVALAYAGDRMRAPRVVAKGTDAVAARIRELAAAHGVPLLEAPPLARALFAHAEVGDEIPAALYNAVAQVLAWVFQLRMHVAGRAPAPPSSLPVPDELDPAAGGRA
ncbi:MAG: flagellar type III secretion system protein FlhB [Burkholderiales bacterium]|nr:flagellar type III secretion system protein FlhB [Burkholderiales bacterium]